MQAIDTRYVDYFRALTAYNHQTVAQRQRTRDAYFRICAYDSPRPEVRRHLQLYSLRESRRRISGEVLASRA